MQTQVITPADAAEVVPVRLMVTIADPPTAVELPRMLTVTELPLAVTVAVLTLPAMVGRQSVDTPLAQEPFDCHDSDKQVRALLAARINSDTLARTV